MNKKFNYQSPKGMHDILPQDQPWWDKIRKETKSVVDFYNYLRIDTPILEPVNLFERSLGAETEIVEKQMFIVKDRSGDGLVLRPEGTASVARAYLQHGLSHLGQPLKLYYEGPMFRYERPQAGRLREFHQIGFEILGGESDAIHESQVILPIFRLLEGLKLKQLAVRINTIGCRNCRPVYVQKLKAYYRSRLKNTCKDCQRRFKFNPLRLLDCKEPECQEIRKNAPSILDSICSTCHRHFKEVLEYLEEVKLPYQLDPYLVRGLDYYNRTVFEIFSDFQAPDGKKFDFALAGGGRYDYLFDVLIGKPLPAIGGTIGADRVIEVMKAANINVLPRSRAKVFLIHMGIQAKKRSLVLLEEFREANIPVGESLGKDSLNAQMRAADKSGAALALIFGQKEVFEDSIIIRDMKTGAQETVPLKKIVNEIKKRI